MATLEIYRDRFAESGWQIFERALAEARRREQNYVCEEHILYSLAHENGELFTSLLRSLSNNSDAPVMLVELIEKRIDDCPKHVDEGVRLAREVIALFKTTLDRVRSNVRKRIEATDLFITSVMDEQSLLRKLLQELLADSRAESKSVRELVAVVESVGASRPHFSQDIYKFLAGEVVRIKSGPFAAFTGTIEKVQEESSTLQIMVFIMGREQPVELRFLDVEKLKAFSA
jgi:ATP-dependent Clp protease ATP-binding subunit ClpA